VEGKDRQVDCQQDAVKSEVKKKSGKLGGQHALTSFKMGKIEAKTDFLISSGRYLSKAVRIWIVLSRPSFI
jgi:hypothetical protein